MSFLDSLGRVLLVLAALGGAAACTSIDDAVAAHGAAAEASVAHIEAVRSVIEKQPLLTVDTVDAGQPLVVDLAERASSIDKPNTAVVYLEDLAELGEVGAVYARAKGTLGVSQCASFARHRTEPWDPRRPDRWNGALLGSVVESRLKSCGRLSHLLVIRSVEMARPGAPRVELSPTSPAAAPPSPGAEVTEPSCGTTGWRCAFDGGYVKAEVHLFSLSPLQHRGGFVVEAENKERLDYPSSSASLGQLLEDDLALAFDTALTAALANKLGGKVVK